MHVIKQIIGLLVVAVMIAVACYFLPFFNSLFADYVVGFFVVAIVLPIGLAMYKSHMNDISKLSPDVRLKREKESQDWWDETTEATHSPSRALDLRNTTNININD